MVTLETVRVAGDLGGQIIDTLYAWIPALNAFQSWAVTLFLLAASLLIAWFCSNVLAGIFTLLTKRTKTQADDILVKKLKGPLSMVIFSVLLYIAVSPLEFTQGTATLIRRMLVSFNILAIAYLLQRFSGAFFTIWRLEFSHRTKSELDDTMLPLLSKFVVVIVWIVALIMILGAWGVEVTPFLAGLGIAGIAIGFAVKDSLAHIVAGVSLALDRAYKVGERIELNDGTTGTVQDMTLRSTRILTFDGDLLMVPNSNMANEPLYTYALPDSKTRVQVHFGVEYGSDPDKVSKLVVKAINKMENIREEPAPSCLFMRMGDSALEMTANFWVDNYEDAFMKKREAHTIIYKTLNKSKVGIPFPTRTVHIKK